MHTNPITTMLLCIIICCQACESNDIESDSKVFLSESWQIIGCEVIDSCASDVAVSYSIFNKDGLIFVGYYDKNHQLSLAKRDRNKHWTYQKLHLFVDWDSHKGIKILVDNDGYVHLFANMHGSPLSYFKSKEPYSIDSFDKCSMIGADEEHCTYPNYLLANDKIIFHYRSGVSGNGVEIFNIYDTYTRKWTRLLDEPLFDGIGKFNSYFYGPITDSFGRYHMVWCWRRSPDCSTNWGIFYSYSDDLKTWNSLSGESSTIPIKPTDTIYTIDDVPEKGGLLNGCFRMGFDDQNNPVIIYHKYDHNDNSNIFCAYPRNHNKDWELVQLTHWDWKWEFSGNGSIPYELYFFDVKKNDESIHCVFSRHQSSSQLLKYTILSQECKIVEYSDYPAILNKKQDANMDLVHVIFDSSNNKSEDQKYLIKYETISPNRDIQSDRVCQPSQLLLYSIIK